MVDSLKGALERRTDERIGEIEALLRLQGLPGVGTRTLWKIVERFGSGTRALRATPADLDAVAGRGSSAALSDPEMNDRVRDAMDRCTRASIRVVTWRDGEYPARLRELCDPPPVLFARGRIELLARPAFTVVGCRRATGYGRRTTESLAGALARSGVVVVSGLALGIDAAAHRGALEASGDTIAVLGSGVDLIQPTSNRRLGEVIAREGLLLSEFLPGESARPHHFPRRNRILAALGMGVLVVEAAERSGALITVEHALDLGRDVYAVPGGIDAPQSRGCNKLIQEGAHVVTSAEDFILGMGLMHRPELGVVLPEPERLGDAACRIWRALGGQAQAVDELARAARLDPGSALAALTELEIDGWAVQDGGMRYRRGA